MKDFEMLKRIAEQLHDKYRPQMDLLNGSILAKVKGSIDSFDVYALGKQLEAFDYYRGMCEADGSFNTLGAIPNIAYDVITAVHGASVLPVICSVQPIEEERGNVYFRQVRSQTTKGTSTAGELLVDPRTGLITNTGFAGASIEPVAAAATVATQVAYSFTLASAPVKSESLNVSVAGVAGVVARDMGAVGTDKNIGVLYGVGLSGTVNYTSGLVNLTFAADPGAGHDILVAYQQNYELSTDLPMIDSYFDSKGIVARVYALKGTIGLLQAFGLSKRFGMVAEDELAKDLVQEINREIGGDMIRKLRAAALGTTTWSSAAPTGVSYFEHKQTYKDYVAKAESVILDNAGRGNISCLIVGKAHAAVIQTLPGFTKISDGNTLGSHVFGTLDGITVVRVVESNILPTNEGIALWKGQSPFESAGVFAPFMPLAVTSTLPQAPNPLISQKAAAVWAGVEVLVPQFATHFNIS